MTSTVRLVAAWCPRMTGVVVRVVPSVSTLKVTLPAPLVSSSTPTEAVKLVQWPPR